MATKKLSESMLRRLRAIEAGDREQSEFHFQGAYHAAVPATPGQVRFQSPNFGAVTDEALERRGLVRIEKANGWWLIWITAAGKEATAAKSPRAGHLERRRPR